MEKKGFFSRKDPRISLDITAEYLRDPIDESPYLPATLKSISMGSFDLETGILLQRDSIIYLRFSIPGESEAAEIICTVLRSEIDKTGLFWRSGLKIINMDEATEKRLTLFLESQGYYGWYYH